MNTRRRSRSQTKEETKPRSYLGRLSCQFGLAFLAGGAKILLNTYIYSYRSQNDRTQALPVLAVVYGISFTRVLSADIEMALIILRVNLMYFRLPTSEWLLPF